MVPDALRGVNVVLANAYLSVRHKDYKVACVILVSSEETTWLLSDKFFIEIVNN